MCIKNTLILLMLTLPMWYANAKKLQPFDEQSSPKAPDYSLGKYWSALPFREDLCDAVIPGDTEVNDSTKKVDVFYVYPTLYSKGKNWNASLENEKLNSKIDRLPVKFQASVFSKDCRIYAPRYRQAIVDVFFHPSSDGDKALELAYQDVKAAFEYYLKHYNHGRPVIIAGHSQGSHHTRRLLKEYFDNTSLTPQLVAAYIIGYQIYDSMYTTLKICDNAAKTGCYISWMSYKEGVKPQWKIIENTMGINPLTWNRDTLQAAAALSKGTVLLKFEKMKDGKTAARLHQDRGQILWVDTRFSILKRLRNLHVADYNLFWGNLRENVGVRINAYFNP